ncbi:MAG: methyl-accepting chemotaxis protein [Lachnospiraceae bacterium]|jgi:methyl-accepting chemotaxis protein|nr:methyl-accepting chemotaxis protein [Lachnospiraceae bacterium]
MKKLFTKRLFFYMLTALVLTIAAIFILQTVVSQKSNDSASRNKLEDVKEKLASNASNIERLTENLSKDNLAKTRAFADMLAQDPSIVGDLDKLKKITERLMVNELHVIDEDGIIISSNFEDYVGFDMKSGEQSNAFMVIVEDPSIEIVQEPQVNASKGIVMQYIGVARTDAKGVVQVGVHPEVLEEMLVGTEISTVLKDMDFGTEGYIYAIDAKSGQILAHRNAELIDTPATDAGFPANYTGKGRAVVDGVKGYYVAEEYDGQIIGTFLPSSEYYAGRSSQTLVVSLSMLLIFGVLLLMINRMVDEKIVQGINQISNSMSEIAAGNFEIVIDEHGNPEFTMLSNNINKMVESICQSINQNERLIEQQKQDMEQNECLIENVKTACRDLNQVSGETLENADHIFHGTGEQEKAVDELKQTMGQLTEELNNSVTMAINVTAATENTSEKIAETQSRMRLLTNSMQKISEMSIKIEKIIGEINSIAHQTNMLSLNASIEAARAGDLGKGFAVVATQVGELAARSAQAAKETNDLIMNSIQAVESGQEITDQTVEAFDIVVEDIRKTDHDVKEITEMVRQNVSIVSNAVSQIERISGVVEGNVQISQDTKQVSSHMANITEKLLNIVE